MDMEGSWWHICQTPDGKVTHEIFGENPVTQQELCHFRRGHNLSLKDIEEIRQSVIKCGVRATEENTSPRLN